LYFFWNIAAEGFAEFPSGYLLRLYSVGDSIMAAELGTIGDEPPRTRPRGDSEGSWQQLGGGAAVTSSGGGGEPAASSGRVFRHVARTNGAGQYDPRLVEKPGLYDGSAESWRLWKVRFVNYMKIVDPRFGATLPEAEIVKTPMLQVPLKLME
jgi:hypothetical protein